MTTTIIILAIALIVWMVLYFRLRADYKELNNAYQDNANNYMDYVLCEQENWKLTAQLDQLSIDADKTDKELFESIRHSAGLQKAIDELLAEKQKVQRCYDLQLEQAKKDDEQILSLLKERNAISAKLAKFKRPIGKDGKFVKKGGA